MHMASQSQIFLSQSSLIFGLWKACHGLCDKALALKVTSFTDKSRMLRTEVAWLDNNQKPVDANCAFLKAFGSKPSEFRSREHVDILEIC